MLNIGFVCFLYGQGEVGELDCDCFVCFDVDFVRSKMGNVKKILVYVLLGTFFTVLFGEFIPVFIADHFVFLEHWLPISLFYVFVSFIFSLFIFRICALKVVGIFFVYGVFMETFLWGNVHDIFGVLFFGMQYVAIFGMPYLITKRILRKG